MGEQRPGLFVLKGLIWRNGKIASPQQRDFSWTNIGVMDAGADPHGQSGVGINAAWNLSIIREYTQEVNGIVVLLKTAGKTIEYGNGVVRSRQASVAGIVWWHETSAMEETIIFNNRLSYEDRQRWQDLELEPGEEINQPCLSMEPEPNTGKMWQLNSIAAANYFNRNIFPLKDVLFVIGEQRKFTYQWLADAEKRKSEEQEKLIAYSQFFMKKV
jgi:hypothetical protein